MILTSQVNNLAKTVKENPGLKHGRDFLYAAVNKQGLHGIEKSIHS